MYWFLTRESETGVCLFRGEHWKNTWLAPWRDGRWWKLGAFSATVCWCAAPSASLREGSGVFSCSRRRRHRNEASRAVTAGPGSWKVFRCELGWGGGVLQNSALAVLVRRAPLPLFHSPTHLPARFPSTLPFFCCCCFSSLAGSVTCSVIHLLYSFTSIPRASFALTFPPHILLEVAGAWNEHKLQIGLFSCVFIVFLIYFFQIKRIFSLSHLPDLVFCQI